MFHCCLLKLPGRAVKTRQSLGWYQADQGAGLIGATVGAVMVLLVWAAVTRSRSAP
jgi:uncharacterized membrane protein YeaQ/YmgE (transglycosylase-associated protein family)